jgi:transcriptional regulator with XRE-family HTH domain
MIKKRLRELRIKEELSQKELAEKLNINQSSISFFETGARIPDVTMLMTLCEFYDVTMDYITGRSDIKYAFQIEKSSEEEYLIYKIYRNLNKTDKEKLISYAEGLAEVD